MDEKSYGSPYIAVDCWPMESELEHFSLISNSSSGHSNSSSNNSSGSSGSSNNNRNRNRIHRNKISKTVKESMQNDMNDHCLPDIVRLKRGAQVVVLSDISLNDVVQGGGEVVPGLGLGYPSNNSSINTNTYSGMGIGMGMGNNMGIAVPCGAQGVVLTFDASVCRHPIVKFSNGIVAVVRPVDRVHTSHNIGSVMYRGHTAHDSTANPDATQHIMRYNTNTNMSNNTNNNTNSNTNNYSVPNMSTAMSTNVSTGVTMVRRQLPLKLAWAMHISECDLISRTLTTNTTTITALNSTSNTNTAIGSDMGFGSGIGSMDGVRYASCQSYAKIELILKLPRVRSSNNNSNSTNSSTTDTPYNTPNRHYGMLYNALSRVNSLSGLWLHEPLSPRWLTACTHPQAMDYMDAYWK